MEAKRAEALFFGFSRPSNTYILCTKGGIVTARSLSRQPIPDRWSHEAVASLKSNPWSERQQREPTVRSQDPAAEADDTAEAAAPGQARRFRLTQNDLR